MPNSRIDSSAWKRSVRRGAAVMLALSLGLNLLGFSASGQRQKAVSRLSDVQRILHVLNRLGFGARPGDVERLKAMGLENYINQQLNPGQISDSVAESKVKNLVTLEMTTAELYEKYPQPGQLLRQLQRRGDLPADLAEARHNRGNVADQKDPKAAEAAKASKSDEMPRNGAAPNNNPNAPARNNEDYRRAIRDYYVQNGLQQPQRITAELQASRILRAVYSERQLQEVMVDFWTNHFNVFAGKGADRWLLISYDRDTIRPHTLGKFSDLLQATAQSPAMLFYLDNFQSVSPNAQAGMGQGGRQQANSIFGELRPRRGDQMADWINQQGGANVPQPPPNPQRQRRGINENYARELMELHSLGVDGGYTQKDVQEVARCFTGWTIFAPRGGAAAAQANMNARRVERLREDAGKFFFNARVHDDGEKIVLGHKIPAGGGMKDGLMVLDILAHHPSTSRYIATKLVRYFVSDSPPPALVDRTAAAFAKSDGDIRETLKAIFFSPEFNSRESYRAKIKRPFELAISAVRTLGADTNGGPGLHQWIARMGEPLYGYQTPNGYSDSAESWVNTGGLLERLNFGLSLASNRIPGTRVDLKRLATDATNGESVDQAKVMDRFLSVIVAGDISPRTRETLLKQLDQGIVLTPPTPVADVSNDDRMMGNVPQNQRRRELARADANITDPVTKIVGLILGSPEFQRQ